MYLAADYGILDRHHGVYRLATETKCLHELIFSILGCHCLRSGPPGAGRIHENSDCWAFWGCQYSWDSWHHHQCSNYRSSGSQGLSYGRLGYVICGQLDCMVCLIYSENPMGCTVLTSAYRPVQYMKHPTTILTKSSHMHPQR